MSPLLSGAPPPGSPWSNAWSPPARRPPCWSPPAAPCGAPTSRRGGFSAAPPASSKASRCASLLGLGWLELALAGREGDADLVADLPLAGPGARRPRLAPAPRAARGRRWRGRAGGFPRAARRSRPPRRPGALAGSRRRPRRGFAAIFGHDPVLQATLEAAERFARTRLPILVLAETGTGKELLARAIHHASPRQGPRLRGDQLRRPFAAPARQRALRLRPRRLHRRQPRRQRRQDRRRPRRHPLPRRGRRDARTAPVPAAAGARTAPTTGVGDNVPATPASGWSAPPAATCRMVEKRFPPGPCARRRRLPRHRALRSAPACPSPLPALAASPPRTPAGVPPAPPPITVIPSPGWWPAPPWLSSPLEPRSTPWCWPAWRRTPATCCSRRPALGRGRAPVGAACRPAPGSPCLAAPPQHPGSAALGQMSQAVEQAGGNSAPRRRHPPQHLAPPSAPACAFPARRPPRPQPSAAARARARPRACSRSRRSSKQILIGSRQPTEIRTQSHSLKPNGALRCSKRGCARHHIASKCAHKHKQTQ